MISRRMIINFVLLVLILIFTYIGNRYDVKTGYQSQPGISKLDPSSIQTLEIQNADISISLRRQETGWSIESPIRWPASNVNVERLLDIVNSNTESRLDAEGVDLNQFGLQFPRAILRFDDTRLLFGATNNVGKRRYTMIDQTIYLLPDNHFPFISQGLISVVDRRLIPHGFELSDLTLPGFDLRRASDNVWQLADNDRIKQPQLDRLIENWQGLEASQVRIFDRKATPRQKIQARLANGKNHEFFVMSIDPEIIIANPDIGLQYHFRAEYYYQLISLRADEDSA